jgi:F-type H+-transporting ATPase subunit b
MLSMLKKTSFSAMFTLASSAMAFATEHADVVEGAHEIAKSDPFSGSLATSIWSVAIFLLLVLILGVFAWAPILESLKKREDHIRSSIEDAENARKEADASLAAYKDQLAKATAESAVIIEQARGDAKRLSEELATAAKADVETIKERATAEIAAAKQQALREICDQVSDLSISIAEKVIGKSISADEHRQLIDDSLSKLQA